MEALTLFKATIAYVAVALTEVNVVFTLLRLVVRVAISEFILHI